MKEMFAPNTFSYSLAIAEAWLFTYPKRMVKELGIGFQELIAYKDWRGIMWLKLLEEQEKFNDFIKDRLTRDRTFFKSILRRYLRAFEKYCALTDVKKIGSARLNNREAWQKIRLILDNISFLLCFYIVIYYVLNWPALRAHFAGMDKEIESARFKTEGLYDRGDRFIKNLLRGQIDRRYLKYYEVLRAAEIRKLLLGGQVDVDNLKVRARLGYVLTLKDFFVGAVDLKKFLEERGYYYPDLDIKPSHRLKGLGVMGGKVRGVARVIAYKRNFRKFRAGEILVVPMTSPDYMPLIKKASALVTDHGGVLCHAAISAREFKVPCVVGTKIATKVFKDGDMVEVDANKGVVRKI